MKTKSSGPWIPLGIFAVSALFGCSQDYKLVVSGDSALTEGKPSPPTTNGPGPSTGPGPVDPTPGPTAPGTPTPTPTPRPVEHALRIIQPAVAVRGAACIMCHADIRGNIITDFGYGDPWYFQAGKGVFDPGWYNNYIDTWKSTDQILGSIYVPDQSLPASVVSTMSSRTPPNQPMTTIASFLTTPYSSPDMGWVKPERMQQAIADGITPPAGSSKVVAKSSIVIRAPEESEILALAPQLQASLDSGLFEQEYLKDATTRPSAISGLARKSGTNGQFFVANADNQTFVCKGADVVVKGPLYLKDLKINADDGGCRLYVAGTVFIEGPVTYVGSSSKQNLQISSSRAVIMGVGYADLNNRLVNDNRGAKVRGSMSFSARAQQILADATTVGPLRDASDLSGVNYPSAPDGSGHQRAIINYSGILLNAPILQSRYFGNVRGSLISEIALFALGAFHYEFDPVFTQVDALPLIETPVLAVQ